ncbi:MAG TPA: D-2-hydroxyacid dehydrogenase [Pirellulales bacterium]|nr:D-2-hydroxyacid dehydrogenase [Pirellulales bacterium]
MRIVLCYPVESKHLAQIARVAPGAEIVDAGQDAIPEAILEADIYCGHAKGRPIDWDAVVRRGRLQWIQSSAAGMDHCLAPSVVASDITVTSASGVLANQVADHTIALMGALARSLPVFFRAQQKREFIRRPTRDLHHNTVGIVGFGGNGRRLAEVFQAFKMRIVATDYFPIAKPEYVDVLAPPQALGELLPEIDYVVLAAPLTEQTRGMIDGAFLQRMKRGAFLVNMARGKLVDERALVAALESGQIAGAAVDVTAEEPLPAESPLWSQPNVIITPHVGGQSARRIDDMTDFFCENLRRYLAGQPLRNYIADKRLGFPRPTIGD